MSRNKKPNEETKLGAATNSITLLRENKDSKGRVFSGGAYRDQDKTKNDYEGYLSPLVIKAYGDYMTKHRVQSNGDLRDSDNWQKGIPRDVYMKSLWRHMHDLWMEQRGYQSRDGIDEALGGLLFNAMGYWFELLKERGQNEQTTTSHRGRPRQNSHA